MVSDVVFLYLSLHLYVFLVIFLLLFVCLLVCFIQVGFLVIIFFVVIFGSFLSFFHKIPVCFLKRQSKKRCVFEWIGRWGRSRRNWGRDKHNQDILCGKKLFSIKNDLKLYIKEFIVLS